MRHRATVFVVNGDKLLLLYRFKAGKQYYAVPGGGVETGETPEQAGIRELKEETNLDIVLGEKIGEFKTEVGDEFCYIAKSFIGTLALGGPEMQRQSPDNIYRLEWIPLEKLGEINFREELKQMLFRFLSPLSHFLNSSVAITIDRPLGSKHPKWNFEYPINYGFVPNTKSDDGEEIDAYVLGITEPLKEFTGKCIAIIHRLNDNDDKLVLVPGNTNFTDEEIREATDFQEQFFKSIILR